MQSISQSSDAFYAKEVIINNSNISNTSSGSYARLFNSNDIYVKGNSTITSTSTAGQVTLLKGSNIYITDNVTINSQTNDYFIIDGQNVTIGDKDGNVSSNISIESGKAKATVKANNLYLGLSKEQQRFFPDDNWLREFYREFGVAERDHSDYEKAKKTEKTIKEIVDSVGTPDEHDIDKLKRAIRMYNSLSSSERKYFDKGVYESARRKLSKAEEDHDERERRRRRDDDDHFGGGFYGGSGSFSGFGGSIGGSGGISNGGGASRGF